MQMWIDNNMISKNTKKIMANHMQLYIYYIRIKHLLFFKNLKYICKQ